MNEKITDYNELRNVHKVLEKLYPVMLKLLNRLMNGERMTEGREGKGDSPYYCINDKPMSGFEEIPSDCMGFFIDLMVEIGFLDCCTTETAEFNPPDMLLCRVTDKGMRYWHWHREYERQKKTNKYERIMPPLNNPPVKD